MGFEGQEPAVGHGWNCTFTYDRKLLRPLGDGTLGSNYVFSRERSHADGPGSTMDSFKCDGTTPAMARLRVQRVLASGRDLCPANLEHSEEGTSSRS